MRSLNASHIEYKSLLESKIVYDADAIEVLSIYGMIREIIETFWNLYKKWEDNLI